MTSIDTFMPGYRSSTVESVSVTGRRLAGFLAAVVVGLAKIVVPHLFTVGALAAFCVAAFTVSLTVGFVVVGASLLLLELRISQE